jgi:hypothetical protein
MILLRLEEFVFASLVFSCFISCVDWISINGYNFETFVFIFVIYLK